MRKSSVIFLARPASPARSITPVSRNRFQKAEAEIFAQGQVKKHAFGVAVVGNKADAGLAKCTRRVAGNLDARDPHLAAGAAIDAGGGTDEFALAFAFDAGESDDLAGVHDKIDLIEAAPAEPADGKQRRPNQLRLGRENLAKRAARDQRNDFRRRN